MVLTTFFSLHKNVNERGTSNPPEGIGDAFYFNDFGVPNISPFSSLIINKMSDVKPLHVRWIVDMYTYLKQQKESILNGFDKAGITEAVKSADEVFARIENPFVEKQANEM